MKKKKEQKGVKNKDLKKDQKDESANNQVNSTDKNEDSNKCPEAVTDTLESLQIQNSELQDKYIRLVAEFENFRKRTRQERLELIETASSDIIKEILPIIDDMERGLKLAKTSDDSKNITEGFNLIYNKLISLLKQKNLEVIKSKGKKFDTDYHEALTMIENKKMRGKVVEEIEKGYMLKGKVIRFAKVIIGN